MTDDHMSPSPFVESWIAELSARAAPQRALDIAMGRGRHALALAQRGFITFGVDARLDAVRDAVQSARRTGLIVRGWCADLTAYELPFAEFDVVVVARYLQRD